jgi:ribonuclease HI
MVRQMTGDYRVKNQGLKPLFERASGLESKIAKVSYRAVRREHNKLADQLVNEALDAASTL